HQEVAPVGCCRTARPFSPLRVPGDHGSPQLPPAPQESLATVTAENTIQLKGTLLRAYPPRRFPAGLSEPQRTPPVLRKTLVDHHSTARHAPLPRNPDPPTRVVLERRAHTATDVCRLGDNAMTLRNLTTL